VLVDIILLILKTEPAAQSKPQ